MQGSCRPGDRARCGAGAGLPRETLQRVGKRQVKPWEASLPQVPIGCRGRDKESLEGTAAIWEEGWMGTGEKPEKGTKHSCVVESTCDMEHRAPTLPLYLSIKTVINPCG